MVDSAIVMPSSSFDDLATIFLIVLYAGLTLSTLLTTCSGFLRGLSSHGKTLAKPSTEGQHWIFSNFLVPKQWFLHFYIVGIVSTTCALVAAANLQHHSVVLLVLPGIQVIRRWYECVFIHQWRVDSKMHASAYFIGLVHYAVLPLVFVVSSGGDENQHNQLALRYAGMVLCLVAQHEQHRHHRILAELRVKSDDRYVLPAGRMFDYISCPTYLTEIGVYAGFCMCLRSSKVCLALFVWVASNQTVSAVRAHAWYHETFGASYKELGRKALVPFLF